MTVGHVCHSDPGRKHAELFHFVIEQEPGGSPTDDGWSAGRFSAHGVVRADVVSMLRRVAERLEKGEGMKEIASP